MRKANPVWLLLQEGDDPTCSVVLYALAQDAGISWKGTWLARRWQALKRGADALPRRTRIGGLAVRLGMHRHTVARALERLKDAGLVVRRGCRWEPKYAVLKARWARSRPGHRFKLPADVLARRDLNLTDKLLLGKIAKLDGQANPWFPFRRWQLAADLRRSVRTVGRSIKRLLGLGLMSKVVRSCGRRVLSSLTTHKYRLRQAGRKLHGRLLKAVDGLAKTFEVERSPPNWRRALESRRDLFRTMKPRAEEEESSQR